VIGDSRRAEAQQGSLGAVAYEVLLNLSSPTIVVHAPAPTGPAGDGTTTGRMKAEQVKADRMKADRMKADRMKGEAHVAG
jgi:pentapeptide MXKDX repeat protein